jgi:hypothetical protein
MFEAALAVIAVISPTSFALPNDFKFVHFSKYCLDDSAFTSAAFPERSRYLTIASLRTTRQGSNECKRTILSTNLFHSFR